MERLHARWGALISQTCRDSELGVRGSRPDPPVPSTEPRFFVPPEFIAALIANESGGNPFAVRFEAGVYRHLLAVADGRSPRYGSLRAQDIEEEIHAASTEKFLTGSGIQEGLQSVGASRDRGMPLLPKTREFHTRFLTATFAVEIPRLRDRNVSTVTSARSDVLRELATSWGLTQIMGYHMVGRLGTPADLAKPEVNLSVAHELLAEFAEEYGLDPHSQFEELFRCWNSGRPRGQTADPEYVAKGLLRIGIYKQESEVRSQKPEC